ncbi:hypothetical protein [Thermospira aquatica]|uniref:Uncharacterized protein n=1 Tax=Thermospira aquatica TaxID=2828656 RepID=A0AAX3BEF7_9SPIR|nr:hypothetical protein [Thermospira aquatica]URA10626.1 hypothetical protein KDW03_02135 [Thermospira aquatica]
MARTAVIVPEQRGRLGFSHYAIRTVLGTQRGPVDWERAGEEAFGVATIGIGAVKGTKVVSGGKSITRVVKAASTEGKSVIGPRSTYREFAKNIGAEFLDVTDEAWTWAKNERHLQEIVKRGDEVIFAGKYDPSLLDPSSVLAKEIYYLESHGYRWTSDFTKMVKQLHK